MLAKSLVEQIAIPPDGVMVDATIGQGGHSYLLAGEMTAEGTLLGIDFDADSIERACRNLSSLDCRLILVRGNFAELPKHMAEHGLKRADFILADLGICSAQIEDEKTGMSFQKDMPLDMRLDKSLNTNAADIVNSMEENSLADLIYEFGQERASRKIAANIVHYRRKQRIKTTGQLAGIIRNALGRRHAKIHPATRTFQALRIAVNNEMENLERLLEAAPDLLNSAGRIAIISFHSLEDRRVKVNFRENSKKAIYELINKKPISPDRDELAENPRAISAKLRIAAKV